MLRSALGVPLLLVATGAAAQDTRDILVDYIRMHGRVVAEPAIDEVLVGTLGDDGTEVEALVSSFLASGEAERSPEGIRLRPELCAGADLAIAEDEARMADQAPESPVRYMVTGQLMAPANCGLPEADLAGGLVGDAIP
jgi:hypothetical protein